MNKTEYIPSIAFHPGDYIRDIVEEMDISQSEFAKRLGINDKVLSDLVNCKIPMSKEVAEKLSTMLGTSISVWLNLQLSYDENLLKNKINTGIKADEPILEILDYNYFVKLGVVIKTRDKMKKIEELRKFLTVSNLGILNSRDFLVNFRSSTSKESNKIIICANAWVQTAINEAKNIETDNYDAVKLKRYIPEIRKMTIEDPVEFVPVLKEKLSECGVALVFLPHLKNSGINGAVKWINNDKAMLAMNARGAYADIFWFAFFHELKHVLQHKISKTFITASKNSDIELYNSKLEDEANMFSTNLLIPPQKYERFVENRYFDSESIMRFSRDIGIHPGIVVGRLQHDRYIQFNSCNEMRVKYQIL